MPAAALPSGPVLVDASLLVALIQGQREARRFVPLLSRAVVTSVNFGETVSKVDQLAGVPPHRVDAALAGLGLQIAPFGQDAALLFVDLKRIDLASRAAQARARVPKAKQRSLSLADMACLAHGVLAGLPVLTGDKHWLTLGRHGLAARVFDFRDPALSW